MNISHIEHVGIAVTSLEEAIPFYEKMLGFKCFAIEEVADQKVRTAFFQVGQTKIELLELPPPRVLSPSSSRRTVAAAASSMLRLLLRMACRMHLTRYRKRVDA